MLLAVAIALAPGLARADSVSTSWTVDDDACSAEAAAVDAAGRLHVACYDLDDRGWRLTSYAPDSTLVAERFLNGVDGEPTPIGSYPRPEGMVVDDTAGVAYVSGALATGVEDDTVGVIAAVNLVDLDVRWLAADRDVEVFGNVALAPDGGVCAVGRAFNGTDSDLVVSRIDASGVEVWTQVVDRGEDDAGTSSFQDVAVDSNGACYAVGSNVVVKVTAGGALAWVLERPALSLALQDDRYVVVTTPLVPHGFTALYELDGTLVWEADVGGLALATADHGDVWVARTEFAGSADWDWEVYRIADDGDVRWSYELGKSRQDMAQDLVIDGDDNVYVTGQVVVPGGLFNLFWVQRGGTVKLGPDGAERWRIDDANAVSPRNITRAGDDTLYVTGLTAHAAYHHTSEPTPVCEWWDIFCWWGL